MSMTKDFAPCFRSETIACFISFAVFCEKVVTAITPIDLFLESNVSVTVLTGIFALTRVLSKVCPFRLIVIVTLVPTLPRMIWTALLSVKPDVWRPLILTIRSLALIPAFEAGVPAIGAMTLIALLLFST